MNYVRLAVRTIEENKKLVSSLKKYLKKDWWKSIFLINQNLKKIKKYDIICKKQMRDIVWKWWNTNHGKRMKLNQ
jgi:hypothetical protein